MFMTFIKSAIRRLLRQERFSTSKEYWINRYKEGGNSGLGSYYRQAQFKVKILNEFVVNNSIETIIEFGCGDGNQLGLAQYPQYTGYDISPEVIELCKKRFLNDPTKTFYLLEEYDGQTADLGLSLDVIFHLIEDDAFENHLLQLFNSSNKYVIIYSSNTNDNSRNHSLHVRHRKFAEWIDVNLPEWKLTQKIPNAFPSKNNPVTGSFSDFYIYARTTE